MPEILSYQPTPIVSLPMVQGVRLLIKREDLNHPFVSGNKWWKLKYNLKRAREGGHHTLLTFGGAFSNHIYATAAAAKELGFQSIGVIRGEENRPLNQTLAFAESCGMKLHFVSREEYRSKSDENFETRLRQKFGSFYLIPEGGTNELAVKGCAELARQLQNECDFDYFCLAVGTGGTMAGIMEGFADEKKVLGFSALKGGEFLVEEIARWTNKKNGVIIPDYHFGGYAKTTPELERFIVDLEKDQNLPLDQVYTAKLMVGVLELVRKGYFKSDATVLILHSGGLQGRRGFVNVSSSS